MAQAHPGIGHRHENQREGGDAEQQRQPAQHLLPGRSQHRIPGKKGQRCQIGTDHKARPQQQRPQTQHCPVQQEAGQASPGLTNTPDGIEGFLDVHQHQEGGDHQQRHPDPGQLPGLLGKLAQIITQCRPGRRHEVVEDETLDLPADLIEGRDRRQHGVGHRHYRYHRKQGSVGQGCGILRTVVFAKTADQIAAEIHQPLNSSWHRVPLFPDSRWFTA